MNDERFMVSSVFILKNTNILIIIVNKVMVEEENFVLTLVK